MPNRPPEDLLSSYLDGELSPVEVTAFEERLAADASLQEQLRELQELSVTFQQLPRPHAPAGLSESILAAIENLVELESPPSPSQVVPTQTATESSPVPSTVPSTVTRSPVPGRRLARWTGTISAGLVLCLLGSLLMIPLQQEEAVVAARNGEMMRQPAGTAGSGESEAFPSLSALTTPAAVPMAAPVMSPRSDRDPEAVADAMAFAPAEAVLANETRDVPVVNLSTDEIRRKIGALKQQPVIGNRIPVPGTLSDEGGETPILVVFTVVDVSQAMNQMQVLLQRQQIRTMENQILQNSAVSIPQQVDGLHVVTMELELDGPEMASLLQGVPALDAVMYVAENSAPAVEKSEVSSETPEFSRASVSAVPQSAVQSGPMKGMEMSAKTLPGVATPSQPSDPQLPGQLVQFNFHQLNHLQSNSQEMNSARVREPMGDAPKANPELFRAGRQSAAGSGSPKDESVLPLGSPAARTRMTKQGDTIESSRLKAFILLQQTPEATSPNSMK